MSSDRLIAAIVLDLMLSACGRGSPSTGSPSSAGYPASAEAAVSVAPSSAAGSDAKTLRMVMPGWDKFPSSTLGVRREHLADIDSLPERAQDAVAAFHFCGGAPFQQMLMRQGRFYWNETVADALTDRTVLATFACGEAHRNALVSNDTKWAITTITLAGSGTRHRQIRAFGGGVPLVFLPGDPRPGLKTVRCQAKTHDACDDAGEAFAMFDMVGGAGEIPAAISGELRDLSELGAPRATLTRDHASRLEALEGRLPHDGDAAVSLRADDLGPLDVADDGGELASHARSELVAELQAEDASVGWAMKSDYLGHAEFRIDLPPGHPTKKVMGLLDAYRKELASLPLGPEPQGDPDESFWRLMTAATRRALGAGKVREIDGGVAFVGEVTPSADDRDAIVKYRKARNERYAALAKLVDAAMSGAGKLPEDELRAFGGDGLVAAVKERASGAPAVPADVKGTTLDTLAGVVVPDGGKITTATDQVRVVYPTGTERTVTAFYGLSRAAGFHIRVTGMVRQGVVGEITRGADSARFLAIHPDAGTMLLFDLE